MGTNESTILKKYKRFRNIYVIDETYINRKVSPATSVVIGISSEKTLKSVLNDMKESIWWSHEARFLVINSLESSCDMAEILLLTLWNFNILSAVYLCQNLNDELVFYTLNPYANVAPKFWNGIPVGGSVNPYKTLFKHQIQQKPEAFASGK